MADTLDEAVREAKLAAGLNPDEKYPPEYFRHQLAAEWVQTFWSRQIDRVVADLTTQPTDSDGRS